MSVPECPGWKSPDAATFEPHADRVHARSTRIANAPVVALVAVRINSPPGGPCCHSDLSGGARQTLTTNGVVRGMRAVRADRDVARRHDVTAGRAPEPNRYRVLDVLVDAVDAAVAVELARACSVPMQRSHG